MTTRPAALLAIAAVVALSAPVLAQPTGPDVNYDESLVGDFTLPDPPAGLIWQKVLDTADATFRPDGGPGSSNAAAMAVSGRSLICLRAVAPAA